MNDDNLVQIIGNISRSLFSVQKMISGLAYLIAILFIVHALFMLKKVAGSPGAREKLFSPVAYLLMGAALLFLPSAIEVMANTAFGTGNVLSYSDYNPYSIKSSMEILIRTAGLIWFIRGCVLIAHASRPGVQEGPKGMVFLFAGIFAMNFENTINFLNTALMQFIQFTSAVKQMSGY